MQRTAIATVGLVSLFTGWMLSLLVAAAPAVAWGLMAVGMVLVVLPFIVEFRQSGGRITSRRGGYSVGTFARVSLFVGIVLLANGISSVLYFRLDLTGLAKFTLTPQTQRVLRNLDQPVRVLSFFSPSSPPAIKAYASNLLDEYRVYTKRLHVTKVDPEVNPDQARKHGVEGMDATVGELIFIGNHGQRRVYGPEVLYGAEYAFTSAILEVTGTKQKTIYFLTGHGEHSIYADYSRLRTILQNNLFKVTPLNLSVTHKIPSDASLVVEAAPTKSLDSSELATLRSYLKRDGRMFVLLEPASKSNIRRLLADWSVQVDSGTVIDPASYVAPNVSMPLIPRQRDAFHLAQTYFPGAAALSVSAHAPAGLDREALLLTSDASWLDPHFTVGDTPTFDKAVDKKGPFVIGALVSTQAVSGGVAHETRLAVIGDSDFVTNAHVLNANNGALFLNVVQWLTEGKDIISVDRKVLTNRRLVISREQARFLQVSSIGVLPLLVLVAGGIVWWRRR